MYGPLRNGRCAVELTKTSWLFNSTPYDLYTGHMSDTDQASRKISGSLKKALRVELARSDPCLDSLEACNRLAHEILGEESYVSAFSKTAEAQTCRLYEFAGSMCTRETFEHACAPDLLHLVEQCPKRSDLGSHGNLETCKYCMCSVCRLPVSLCPKPYIHASVSQHNESGAKIAYVAEERKKFRPEKNAFSRWWKYRTAVIQSLRETHCEHLRLNEAGAVHHIRQKEFLCAACPIRPMYVMGTVAFLLRVPYYKKLRQHKGAKYFLPTDDFHALHAVQRRGSLYEVDFLEGHVTWECLKAAVNLDHVLSMRESEGFKTIGKQCPVVMFRKQNRRVKEVAVPLLLQETDAEPSTGMAPCDTNDLFKFVQALVEFGAHTAGGNKFYPYQQRGVYDVGAAALGMSARSGLRVFVHRKAWAKTPQRLNNTTLFSEIEIHMSVALDVSMGPQRMCPPFMFAVMKTLEALHRGCSLCNIYKQPWVKRLETLVEFQDLVDASSQGPRQCINFMEMFGGSEHTFPPQNDRVEHEDTEHTGDMTRVWRQKLSAMINATVQPHQMKCIMWALEKETKDLSTYTRLGLWIHPFYEKHVKVFFVPYLGVISMYEPFTSLGGSLCDDMGLGKTLEVLGLTVCRRRGSRACHHRLDMDDKRYIMAHVKRRPWRRAFVYMRAPMQTELSVSDTSNVSANVKVIKRLKKKIVLREASPEQIRGCAGSGATGLKKVSASLMPALENHEFEEYSDFRYRFVPWTYTHYGNVLETNKTPFLCSGGTLIIVPVSMFEQWNKSFKKFVLQKSFKVVLYYGLSRTKELGELMQADVVLTTYSVVQKEMSAAIKTLQQVEPTWVCSNSQCVPEPMLELIHNRPNDTTMRTTDVAPDWESDSAPASSTSPFVGRADAMADRWQSMDNTSYFLVRFRHRGPTLCLARFVSVKRKRRRGVQFWNIKLAYQYVTALDLSRNPWNQLRHTFQGKLQEVYVYEGPCLAVRCNHVNETQLVEGALVSCQKCSGNSVLERTYGSSVTKYADRKVYQHPPLLGQVTWTRLVLDEAHQVSTNINTFVGKFLRLVQAQSRWVVTGTPFNHKSRNAWNLASFADIGPQDVVQSRVMDAWERSSSLVPLVVCNSMRHTKDMVQNTLSSELQQMSRYDLVVPCHYGISDSVGYVPCSPGAECALFEHEVPIHAWITLQHNKAYTHLRNASCERIGFRNMTLARALLRCCRPFRCPRLLSEDWLSNTPVEGRPDALSVHDTYIESVGENCPICWDEPMTDPVACTCKHVFCRSCITQVLSRSGTCPLCRKRERVEDLKVVRNTPISDSQTNAIEMALEYMDSAHDSEAAATDDLDMSYVEDQIRQDVLCFEQSRAFQGARACASFALEQVSPSLPASPTTCWTAVQEPLSKELSTLACRRNWTLRTIRFALWHPKIRSLCGLLTSGIGLDRILLVCSSGDMFDFIASVCRGFGYKIFILTSSLDAAQRSRTIDDFQHNDAQKSILLTTYHVGSVGITLTQGRSVVLFDIIPDASCMEQVVGRVHRMGQTRDVLVFKLFTPNSLEEQVYRVHVENSQVYHDWYDESRVLCRVDLERVGTLSSQQGVQSALSRISYTDLH